MGLKRHLISSLYQRQNFPLKVGYIISMWQCWLIHPSRLTFGGFEMATVDVFVLFGTVEHFENTKFTYSILTFSKWMCLQVLGRCVHQLDANCVCGFVLDGLLLVTQSLAAVEKRGWWEGQEKRCQKKKRLKRWGDLQSWVVILCEFDIISSIVKKKTKKNRIKMFIIMFVSPESTHCCVFMT